MKRHNRIVRSKISTEIMKIFTISSSVFLLGNSSFSSAQTSSVADTKAPLAIDADTQKIVVTGFRESLRKALNIKKNSNEIVEAIGLDDLGKLPDKSIADSLKQLPGVTAGIDRGNASQIIIRGMGPRLSFTTLNGREVASSEPDRSVRLEQFPAELMSGAQIYKTQSASLVEGGIAGTVNLSTVNPLDLKEARTMFSFTGAYYPQASKLKDSSSMNPALDLSKEKFSNSIATKAFGGDTPFGDKLSFGYVDQFMNHTLGVAFGLGYQDQQSTYKGFANWGYDGTDKDTAGNKVPWGFQSFQGGGREQRNSLMGKVQWKPSGNVELTYDVYYAQKKFNEFDTERWVNAWKASDYSNSTSLNGFVVGGTVKPESLDNANANYIENHDVFMQGLNGKFKLGEWKLVSDLSTSSAKRQSVWFAVVNSMKKSPTVTWNTNASEPTFSLVGDDPNNPASYSSTGTFHADRYAHLNDIVTALKVDLSRSIDSSFISNVLFGARLSSRSKDYDQISWKLKGQCTNISSLSSFSHAVKSCPNNATSPAGRVASAKDIAADWKVKEDVNSVYAQADISTEIGKIPVSGNFGVRIVETKSWSSGQSVATWADASTGWEDVTTITPLNEKQTYRNILPSLNLNFEVAQDRIVRFGLARAMARAPIDELRAGLNVSRDFGAPAPKFSGSAGNPTLKPYIADQFDLYHDWYFAKDSLLSIGAFYKNVKTYVGLQSYETTIAGTPAKITRPINGTGGRIDGIELVYQQPFTFLPSPFKDFGLFANYSYVESNIKELQPVDNPVNMNGLTKHNFSANLWYQNNGFEGRLGYSYHSAFTRQVDYASDPTGTEKASGWWNLGLSQKVGKNQEIKFQVDNLTNAKLQTYNQNQTFNWGKYQEFGRRYLLSWSITM
jgi:iron complex outermembrane receptor protein